MSPLPWYYGIYSTCYRGIPVRAVPIGNFTKKFSRYCGFTAVISPRQLSSCYQQQWWGRFIRVACYRRTAGAWLVHPCGLFLQPRSSVVWSVHLRGQWPWVTLKVIGLLQDLSNAIWRTLVRHFAWFKWHCTSRVPSAIAELLVVLGIGMADPRNGGPLPLA